MGLETILNVGSPSNNMGLKIYNTEARKLQAFKPIEEGKVGIYVCGPTVNDVPHLGHARQQITFDILRKYLEYSGYNVTFVSNVTDIDDKIIIKAEEQGVDMGELTEKNLAAHTEDYAKIGVKKPDVQPRATEYVKEMIDLVQRLDDKGFTYTIEEDGVYYDVSKFEHYGNFSGQKREKLKAGARIGVKDKKRNPEDFVLWKFSKPGEPEWNSPWGKGRPNWHIECSAMSANILGLPFDIHGGGQDLIFPHHENEVAQSEAAYGKKLANYWMHNGMVNVDNVKMSKSLGNFKTIRDLLAKYPGEVIRYFVLSSHYRKPIDFSEETLGNAQNSYERLKNILEDLEDDGEKNDKYLKKYREGMDNDLNTPVALSTLWQLVRDQNAKGKYQTIQEIDEVLGLKLLEKKEIDIPENIQKLVQERLDARRNKNWELADKKRDEISQLGYQVDDTLDGSKIKKK
jgi:cysteinyl-tRNA synthetase